MNKDSVWIEVIALAGQRSNLVSALLSSPYGMTDTINNGNSRIVTGKYPIKNLAKLDSLPISSMINYCRPLYAPSVLSIGDRSKGDSAMRADIARNGFNLSGNGIKVGLISDSYNTLKKANFDITNGELPGTGNPNGDLTNVIV
ncbi:MAG TPA: hypothetical protein PKX59_04070, partial [Bacteroidia bacterium]|nr:hypothetical protein [Bacteroidia bacterium]